MTKIEKGYTWAIVADEQQLRWLDEELSDAFRRSGGVSPIVTFERHFSDDSSEARVRLSILDNLADSSSADGSMRSPFG